ncbi:MAG: tRNA pseudouridine(38-40) synthase TruA [bacterium]
MKNYKLTIEYDGTRYSGWQKQKNAPSIQSEIERCLAQIFQEKVNINGAGRTDAGVHARGQVANFKIERDIAIHALQQALNGLLPEDIAIVRIEGVEEQFHARHRAKARVYRYQLALRPIAIERHYYWYVGGYQLDESLMHQCASRIIGEHDFSSFCKIGTSVQHFRCIIAESVWSRENKSKLVFTIKANRFLYGMVRALVGTMVEIGRGHRPFIEFEHILEAKDRGAAGMTAPANGLVLDSIIY